MNSFAKYLDISLNHIPPALLSTENKNIFLKSAGYLPDTFAHSLFGYEKVLTDEYAIMDMSISAAKNNFNKVFEYPDIAQLSLNNSHWKNLEELSRQWSNCNSSLYKNLELIALEFDLSSLSETTPVPSVFFGIETLHNTGFDPELRLNVFIKAIEIVSGIRLDPKLKEKLESISTEAGSFHLFQVGLMLSRINSPIKICLKRFNVLQLLEFFPKIIQNDKWIKEVNRVAEKYFCYFDHFVLVFDISGTEIKRTGIECYYQDKKQPSTEKRWKEIIVLLVRDGLCTKENAECILDFPGKFMTGNSSSEHPEYYAQGLHHIKFTIKEEMNSSAKIYLWSGFHWK
jgi:hypothetical protein